MGGGGGGGGEGHVDSAWLPQLQFEAKCHVM